MWGAFLTPLAILRAYDARSPKLGGRIHIESMLATPLAVYVVMYNGTSFGFDFGVFLYSNNDNCCVLVTMIYILSTAHYILGWIDIFAWAVY
jgi:hypothetical protein